MLFEGPEKKLEILTAEPFPSLRTLGDDFWSKIVQRARARIISSVSTDACDAYLLSESSLFVCDRRVVMITCGRTTLIDAALELLDRIPGDKLASLIYERKNENFPELQHTTFENDAARLHAKAAGTAVSFGDRAGDHIDLFHLDRPFEPDPGDATLEILMYDMPSDVNRLFAKTTSPADLRGEIGLTGMFTDFLVDDHLFDPAGYSFNGVLGEFYTTLHVTPQRKGSYTSFETNYALDAAGVETTVSRILGFFRPARSDVLLFQSPLRLEGLANGFRVTATQSFQLGCGYAVAYAHVERELASEDRRWSWMGRRPSVRRWAVDPSRTGTDKDGVMNDKPKPNGGEQWIEERFWDFFATRFKIKQVLFSGKSPYQKVDVVETEGHGKMLLNDGLVMITERDEFVYHEMIAHVPLFVHPEPAQGARDRRRRRRHRAGGPQALDRRALRPRRDRPDGRRCVQEVHSPDRVVPGRPACHRHDRRRRPVRRARRRRSSTS